MIQFPIMSCFSAHHIIKIINNFFKIKVTNYLYTFNTIKVRIRYKRKCYITFIVYI